VAKTNTPTEWLQVDLGRVYDVKAVQVNYADWKSGLYGTDSSVYTAFLVRASEDGQSWTVIADWSRERRDHADAYVELQKPVRARYLRYEHVHVGARNLAISDLRVFGNGARRPPATPRGLTTRREADERNAMISWQPVPGVVGYNVRWGIAPDRLYETYQRWSDQPTTFELRALSVGQQYWAAIESFDENGVSQLSSAVAIR
jgi:hypothetical protein